MKKGIVGMLAVAGLAAAANAQFTGGWTIEVEYMPGSGGEVKPSHPYALVRILAGAGGGANAFAGGSFELRTSGGDWSLNGTHAGPNPPAGSLFELFTPAGDPFAGVVNPRANRVMKQVQDPLADPIGTQGGFLAGSNVENIVLGQLGPPFFTPRDGTIPVWEAVWTTANFTGDVTLETITDRYSVYEGQNTHAITAFEGSGRIRVIPTPSSLALLGLGGLVALRRRR